MKPYVVSIRLNNWDGKYVNRLKVKVLNDMRKYIVILALLTGLASIGLILSADIHSGKPILSVPALLNLTTTD